MGFIRVKTVCTMSTHAPDLKRTLCSNTQDRVIGSQGAPIQRRLYQGWHRYDNMTHTANCPGAVM